MSKHLPCPECGAEAADGEDTKTTVELGFEFQGQQAEEEFPAKECPECGTVFAI